MDAVLHLQALVLNLEIEVLFSENVGVRAGGGSCGVEVAFGQALGNLALQASREANQATGVLGEKLLAHARLVVEAVQGSLRSDLDQIAVAFFVLGQHQEVVVGVALGCGAVIVFLADVEFAADDGLHAGVLRRVDKVDRAKDVAVVGHSHGGHSKFFYSLAEFLDVTGAVEHGIVDVEVQVDELGHGFGRGSLPQSRQRKTGQLLGIRGQGLVRARSRGLGFLQQAAGLGDEFCDFEGLNQVVDVVFLQEGFFVAGAVRVGEQEVRVHSLAILFEPLVGLFGTPLAGHSAVHDEGVKGLGEQASLHILAGLGGDDCGARARENVAFEFEDGFLFFYEKHSAVDGAFVQTGRGFRGFGFDIGGGHCGQANFDDGAALRSIVRGDVPTMLLHDAVADAESESGTLAHTLGGVKGIEDALGVFDSGTVVGELSANVSTNARDTNSELAGSPGLKNGIDCVVDDVQEYLLDLMRISDDQRWFRGNVTLDLDVVDFEVIVAQRQGLVEDLADVDFVALWFALAGEG